MLQPKEPRGRVSRKKVVWVIRTKKFNLFTEKDHQTRFFVSFSSMEKENKLNYKYYY